jgi:hypothetical protein
MIDNVTMHTPLKKSPLHHHPSLTYPHTQISLFSIVVVPSLSLSLTPLCAVDVTEKKKAKRCVYSLIITVKRALEVVHNIGYFGGI